MGKMENITKIYVTSKNKLTEHELCYLTSINSCFPLSIKNLGRWNWLVEIEYKNHKNLLSLLKTTKLRDKDIIENALP